MVKEPYSRVTLKSFARVAAWMFRIRGILILIGAFGVVWMGRAIADPATESARVLIPISLVLWSAVALGTAYTLPLLPPPIEAGDGFWMRARKRLLHFGYGFAVVVSLALGGVALFMSLRALSLSGA